MTSGQDSGRYPELRAKYVRWGRVTGYQDGIAKSRILALARTQQRRIAGALG